MYALLFSFPLFGLLLFSVKWLAIVMNTEQCYVSIQMVRAFAFMLWICVCSWRRACVTWKVHFLVAALYNVFTWKLITFIEKLFSFRFCFFFVPQLIPCCVLTWFFLYRLCDITTSAHWNQMRLNWMNVHEEKGTLTKIKTAKKNYYIMWRFFLLFCVVVFFMKIGGRQ